MISTRKLDRRKARCFLADRARTSPFRRRATLSAAWMLTATISSLTTLPSVRAADTPIAAAVAGLYVGQEQVVEGKVTAVEQRDNSVRLTFGTSPHSLAVSLVIGLLSRFPEKPESYYLGKNVRVTGTIESFRGTPEITVHDPDHIQLAETGFGAAPARQARDKEAGEVRQQLDRLRSQVQELESRLKQLENPPAAP